MVGNIYIYIYIYVCMYMYMVLECSQYLFYRKNLLLAFDFDCYNLVSIGVVDHWNRNNCTCGNS